MISAEKHRSIEIDVTANLLQAQKESHDLQLAAYVFGDARLLGMAELDARGKARIALQAPARVGDVRVLVGPRLAKGEKPGVSELVRRGAQEQHVQIGLQKPRDVEFTIPPILWKCWLRSAHFVKGTLLKRSTIGDSEIDLPVCDARVEIYEVDPLPLLIPRLPDAVLDRLRDLLVSPATDPALALGPAVALDAVSGDRLAAHAAAQEPARAPAALRRAAVSGSKVELRQALVEHTTAVRPLLWRYFPRLMTMQRVATATTDRCGHFQALFFQGCFTHDKPDLYFKATQKISATDEITIYEPRPVAAHTWWDHASGAEVTLYTAHPQAYTCAPCEPPPGPDTGRWVAFLAIGNTPLSRIHGTSKELADATPPAERAARLGLTGNGRPWGGLLRPRLEFSGALEAAGVTYYRVSWRRAGTGNFQPLQGGVQRYYRHEVGAPGDTFPAWSPVTLGPSTVNGETGLMKIPYASLLPAGASWEPPPGGNELVEHLSSAKFPTHELAPGLSFQASGAPAADTVDRSGLYELEVALFDQTGQRVDASELGIEFVVPTAPDPGGTIHTVNADDPALDLVHDGSMIITLRVDNNHCFADIAAPRAGTAVADACCGVLQAGAGASVTLGYTARHPHGFARYDFSVVRGVRPVVTRPYVPVDDPGTPASEDPNQVPLEVSVHALMTANPAPGCDPDGCTVAGFSENLHVYSLATDGWGSLSYLGASKVRAFVLSRA
jgi:hypothetical protein